MPQPASSARAALPAFAWLAAGILAACLAAAPARAAELHELLRQSSSAERKLSYKGTKRLTQRVGSEMRVTTAEVYHVHPDKTLLVGVSGDLDGARILQIGKESYRMKPGGEYERSPVSLFPDNTALLVRNYVIKEQRFEPIAQRKCVMVLLKPKYPGNPSKRVWLDLKSGMALKTQIWSWKGELIDETEFVLIQFHVPFEESLFALPPGVRRQEWPKASPNFRVLGVRPAGIPPGYRRTENLSLQVPGLGVISLQRFCDGLNTITLLQSRNPASLRAFGGRIAISGRVGEVHYAVFGTQNPVLLKRMTLFLGS